MSLPHIFTCQFYGSFLEAHLSVFTTAFFYSLEGQEEQSRWQRFAAPR